MEQLRRYKHADMAYLLDADPSIRRWTSQQPASVPDGAPFVPDFTVELRDGGICFIQITETALADCSASGFQLVAKIGDIQYLSISATRLTQHHRLSVAKDLFFYRAWEWPETLPIEVAAAGGIENLGDLHDMFGGSQDAWGWLISLVAHGYIEINLDDGLSRSTRVLARHTEGYEP